MNAASANVSKNRPLGSVWLVGLLAT